jgi:2-oxoglutarate ferredoxin oxidoreductase subunit beta
MALSYGASFVARLFAGDSAGITNAIVEGVNHPGFAFFHIYTSCVTFDKAFKTWEHLKEWVYPLPEDHDPGDRRKAFARALEDKFSLGIIYKRQGRENKLE